MLYLCGSLERREPCPGTRGRATAGRVCPQKSGKVSCSLDAVQKPEASSAVLISYTHTHPPLVHSVDKPMTLLYWMNQYSTSEAETLDYITGSNFRF